MKADLKNRWLEALRSGKYEQATGALMAEIDDGAVGYCCLGVLCDISGFGEWEHETYEIDLTDDEQAGFDYEKDHIELDGDLDTLSESRFGLPKQIHNALTTFNDGLVGVPDGALSRKSVEQFLTDDEVEELGEGGWDFEQIAAFIEGNVPVEG